MLRRLAIAMLLLFAGAAAAQQPIGPPTPLLPATPAEPPPSIAPEPLPPLPAAPGPAQPDFPPPPAREPDAPDFPPPPPAAAPPASRPSAARGPERQRVFCQQTVTFRIADRAAAPEPFRRFLGIWSDAAWTPQLCAALIVEGVQPDGTAALIYVVGPMGAGARGPGGVLRGTGIIEGNALKFQNSDGTQFEFRPFYADLAGRLTTPQGQSYQAIFKKNL